MRLGKRQLEQFKKQYPFYRHPQYEVDILLDDVRQLRNFQVYENVYRPENTTSIHLARFLWENPPLYDGKSVIDMGCGSFIQGAAASIRGAKFVLGTDKSERCCENALENIDRYDLNAEARQGDLFENVDIKAALIVYHHPFFFDATIEELLQIEDLDNIKLPRGNEIHRFFEDARNFLSDGGRIIMPYYHIAGRVNNPEIQAPKHGYQVIERWKGNVRDGLRPGKTAIYELIIADK